MKIFFTASFYGKKKYQRYYDLVLGKVEESDVEVIGTEKGNYMDLIPKGLSNKKMTTKALHYEAIKRGILWADAVIIENSYEDFQLGHEATLAIQTKKHVLCVSLNEDFSEKIKNKYFHGAKYNEYNISEVIEDFLKKVKGERYSERFNCFLSKRQLDHLRRKAEKEGVNVSEYLRGMIDNDKSDETD